MKTLKKAAYLITIVALGFAINACEDDEEKINQLPEPAVLLLPANEALVSASEATLTWQASTDAEGDRVQYTVYIASDTNTWSLYSAGSALSYEVQDLEPGLLYYWKVQSENDLETTVKEEEGISMSAMRNFYTAPNGVDSLRSVYGYQQVTIMWDEPEQTDGIEISFSPAAAGITQPVEVSAGTGQATFTGLDNGTIYTFGVSVKYNDLLSFPDTIKEMPLMPDEVHDIDFNIYTTTTIGTQTWLRENLRATRYNDGSVFMNYDGSAIELDYLVGSFSEQYGLYYYALIAYGGPDKDKSPCPCGYHVPSDNEWKTLERYLGMPDNEVDTFSWYFYRGEDEGIGGVLKSQTGWANNGNGVDMFGLKLLPAGYLDRESNTTIEESVDSITVLWTSTSNSDLLALIRVFSYESDGIRVGQSGSVIRGSIRCIKDSK